MVERDRIADPGRIRREAIHELGQGERVFTLCGAHQTQTCCLRVYLSCALPEFPTLDLTLADVLC